MAAVSPTTNIKDPKISRSPPTSTLSTLYYFLPGALNLKFVAVVWHQGNLLLHEVCVIREATVEVISIHRYSNTVSPTSGSLALVTVIHKYWPVSFGGPSV
jgi:hypothetical protein